MRPFYSLLGFAPEQSERVQVCRHTLMKPVRKIRAGAANARHFSGPRLFGITVLLQYEINDRFNPFADMDAPGNMFSLMRS